MQKCNERSAFPQLRLENRNCSVWKYYVKRSPAENRNLRKENCTEHSRRATRRLVCRATGAERPRKDTCLHRAMCAELSAHATHCAGNFSTCATYECTEFLQTCAEQLAQSTCAEQLVQGICAEHVGRATCTELAQINLHRAGCTESVAQSHVRRPSCTEPSA